MCVRERKVDLTHLPLYLLLGYEAVQKSKKLTVARG